MRHGAISLSAEARRIVETTIRAHCTHRSWTLLALNVRTNHVHVVVACAEGVSPEETMTQLKAWCTRRLREAECLGPRMRAWTEHGSTRWINDQASLKRAIKYVTYQQ